jgi:hypothetical protein
MFKLYLPTYMGIRLGLNTERLKFYKTLTLDGGEEKYVRPAPKVLVV